MLTKKIIFVPAFIGSIRKKPVVEVVDSKNINDVVNNIKQKQSDKSVQEERVDNNIPQAKVTIG